MCHGRGANLALVSKIKTPPEAGGSRSLVRRAAGSGGRGNGRVAEGVEHRAGLVEALRVAVSLFDVDAALDQVGEVRHGVDGALEWAREEELDPGLGGRPPDGTLADFRRHPVLNEFDGLLRDPWEQGHERRSEEAGEYGTGDGLACLRVEEGDELLSALGAERRDLIDELHEAISSELDGRLAGGAEEAFLGLAERGAESVLGRGDGAVLEAGCLRLCHGGGFSFGNAGHVVGLIVRT